MGRFEDGAGDWLSNEHTNGADELFGESWIGVEKLSPGSDDWVAASSLCDRAWPTEEVQLPAEVLPALPLALPNAGEGLRNSPIRCDLTALEEFLCRVRQWAVHQGTLCLYSPPCWRRLDAHAAEVEIRRTLREQGFDGPLISSDYRELRKMLLLNPDLQVAGEFVRPELCLNLADGTLDVLSGVWRAHDPADGFFSFLDLTLRDISAGESTGAFDCFVQQISNGDEDIRHQLLELVGLVVTGYPLKHFFVLVGPSNTGKSQFGRFLGELVGRDYVETIRDIDDFGDKWTMGALRGKKLVTCLDLPNKPLSLKAVGIIKQLAGDDAVKGEYKGGELFTFYDKPLLVCAGNFPIRVPRIERDQAFLNRMVCIPFTNPVRSGEERQRFYQELLDDAPYIVSCALETIRELAAHNFQLTRVELPDEYAPQEGNEGIKAVKAFVDSCCELAENIEVTTADLFEGYREMEGSVNLSETEFARLLSSVLEAVAEVEPCKRIGKTERRGYRGIQLKGSCNYQK